MKVKIHVVECDEAVVCIGVLFDPSIDVLIEPVVAL